MTTTTIILKFKLILNKFAVVICYAPALSPMLEHDDYSDRFLHDVKLFKLNRLIPVDNFRRNLLFYGGQSLATNNLINHLSEI